ncbi:nSTAND1 domain-containing NTPase [Kocuria rosea]|uniref:nSTAND1 domain-containing NTPase n=1 Tax=Kocuria rosea TaxID=1275 RepID=UPI00203FD0EA|nr:helix-turn-helix domain-containing protein [Kocuria rosea]MCM3688729.1 helix-turn-helix domain-containing protein [Kocuria rosea]
MTTPRSGAGRPRLAEQLSAARHRRGLSVRALAAACGLPASTIQGWLSGAHLPGPALRREFTVLLEALGLTEERPAAQWWADVNRSRTPVQPTTTPYVGLRAYRPEDEAHFFGRAAEVAELGARVTALAAADGPRILAVVGASGAGKSSLLGAGLLGRLRAEGQPLHGWSAVTTTPGLDPQERLSGVLADDPDLLVVDQLEELWTSSPEPERAARFLERLAAAGRGRVVVVGLRADFFGTASRHTELRAALERPVLLGALSREQLRGIVVGPAEAVGARVSPDLVGVVLRDAAPRGTEVGVGLLPLLSQALLGTWEHARTRELTVADYHAAGGITEALDRRAEEAYAELDPHEREVARAVLLRLVRVVGTGSSATVVRTPVLREELPQGGAAVVEHFARARLLTIDRDEIQLGHEALLDHWSRLNRWIEDSRRDLYVRQQLQRATQMWLANDRDPLALIPLGQLASFRDWTGDPRQQALLSPAEREYLEESERHYDDALARQQRSAREIERRGRVALVLLALAVCAAVVAGVLGVRAERYQAAAEDARDEALSRQTALEASRIRGETPDLAAQLSLAAYRIEPTREGISALVDATAVASPERLIGPEGASRLAALDDGSVVARAAGDGTLSVWRGTGRLDTGREDVAVVDDDPGLRDVDLVVRDGRVLAAVAGEGHVSLWDVTEQPAQRLGDAAVGADTPVNAVVLSPDGRQLLAGGAGEVLRWSLEDLRAPGALLPLELDDPGAVTALAAAADGTVYVGGAATGIDRFAAGERQPRRLERVPTGRQVLSLDLAGDGERLAAGLAARELRLFEVSGDRVTEAGVIGGFDSWVSDVNFSADGERIVSASYDQHAYVHRIADRSTVDVYPTPSRVTSALGVGGRVLTTSQDGTTRAWDRYGPVVQRRGEPVYQLSTDRDHTVLSVVGVGEDVVSLLDLTGEHPRQLPAPQAPRGESLWFAGAVAPDASFVAGGTEDGDLLVWPLEDGRPGEPTRTPALDAAITGAGITADGTTLAAWSEVGIEVALLRRAGDGTVRRVAALPVAGTEAAQFHPSGRLLAAADDTGHVTLWDVADPQAPRRSATLRFDSVVTSLAFSPAEELMAVGTESGRVHLWDVTDPAAPRSVAQAADALSSVKGMQFSPDGASLAGAAGDKFVWMWEVGDGGIEVVGALSASGERMNDVRFAGDRLIAAGDDGVVRSWIVDADTAAAHVCAHRGDPVTETEWGRHVPGAPYRPLC